MLNIGFKKPMLRCAVMGIVCLTLPSILLNSMAALGLMAFLYTAWVLTLGFLLAVALFIEESRKSALVKRDEKGRFVKHV